MASVKFPWGRVVSGLIPVVWTVLRYFGLELPDGLDSIGDIFAGGIAGSVATKQVIAHKDNKTSRANVYKIMIVLALLFIPSWAYASSITLYPVAGSEAITQACIQEEGKAQTCSAIQSQTKHVFDNLKEGTTYTVLVKSANETSSPRTVETPKKKLTLESVVVNQG